MFLKLWLHLWGKGELIFLKRVNKMCVVFFFVLSSGSSHLYLVYSPQCSILPPSSSSSFSSLTFLTFCSYLPDTYLFKLWFSLDICPGVGLLDHIVAFFFSFFKEPLYCSSVLFSIVGILIYIHYFTAFILIFIIFFLIFSLGLTCFVS